MEVTQNSRNSGPNIVYEPNPPSSLVRKAATITLSTAAGAVIAGIFASFAEMYYFNTNQVNSITAIYAAPAILIGAVVGLATGIFLAKNNNRKVHQI